jgi:hypothetical protein
MSQGKQHEPTEKTRQYVIEHVSYLNETVEQIADGLGLSKVTLYKYYEDELKNGKPLKVIQCANNMFRLAASEDESIAFKANAFLLKTLGRWRETDNKDIDDMQKGLQVVSDEIAQLRASYQKEY